MHLFNNIYGYINVYSFFTDSGTDGESQSSSKEQLSERKMSKAPPLATITYKVMCLIYYYVLCFSVFIYTRINCF